MERFYNYRLLVFALLGLMMTMVICSCQNNGNIGDLYGQWQLRQMQVSDQPVSPDGLYISFQSSTMWVKSVNEADHLFTDCFGRYELKGDSLIVSFRNTSEIKSVELLVNQRFCFSDTTIARLGIRLDSDQLLLTSGEHYWQFIKY